MRKHADSLKPNSPHAYAWRLRGPNFLDDVLVVILLAIFAVALHRSFFLYAAFLKALSASVAASAIRYPQFVALHLVDQSLSTQAQESGGLLLVVPRRQQHFGDHLALQFLHGAL